MIAYQTGDVKNQVSELYWYPSKNPEYIKQEEISEERIKREVAKR